MFEFSHPIQLVNMLSVNARICERGKFYDASPSPVSTKTKALRLIILSSTLRLPSNRLHIVGGFFHQCHPPIKQIFDLVRLFCLLRLGHDTCGEIRFLVSFDDPKLPPLSGVSMQSVHAHRHSAAQRGAARRSAARACHVCEQGHGELVRQRRGRGGAT